MSTISNIFHPTDLSAASDIAFVHALRLALAAKGGFTVMHVAGKQHVHREDLPGVRGILGQWGCIPPDSGQDAIRDLGLSVRKVISHRSSPVQACQDYLEEHAANLVVLAVHRHGAGIEWLRHSVGDLIVRNSGEQALLIPEGTEGFVNRADGSLSLGNILVPVANQPRPQAAIDAVQALAELLELPTGHVTLLYIGDEGNAPSVRLPADSQLSWEWVYGKGDVVDGILQTAQSTHSDLVVMVTEGRNGFFDALRGSTSEQVLRKIHCPLLNVPA